MVNLIFTIGISGAGKSRILKSYPQDIIVSPDEIRRELYGDISNQSDQQKVWGIARSRLVQLLNSGSDAILDATNVDRKLRISFMNAIKQLVKLPIKTTAIVIDVDLEVAKKRVRSDIENGVDRSDVPNFAIDRMYQKFQNGLSSVEAEFDEVIYV